MARKEKTMYLTVKYYNKEQEMFFGNTYNYEVTTNKTVKEGQYVVINDELSEYDCLKIVKVMSVQSIKDNNIGFRKKKFIGFADLSDYFAQKEREQRIRELEEELEEKAMQANKRAYWEKLSESDPEMKEMLDELKSLES